MTGPLRQSLVTHEGWLWLILAYNAFAFALQLPLGILADRLGRSWRTAAAGAVLVAAGWLFHSFPPAACVLAGIGNALFHLGGGREILLLSRAEAGPAGIFVASGALGVWLGVWCARAGHAGAILPVLGMLLAGALMARLGRRQTEAAKHWTPAPLSPSLLLAAALLTLTVILRSWVGTQMAFPWKTGILGLIAVLCVVAGKALGGLTGDRFGWVRTGLVTLALAAVCFLPSFRLTAAGLAAVLLFNTTMSITLAALARQFGPAHCGAAFGLTTFALFLGLIPDLLSLPHWGASPIGLCLSALLSSALLTGGLLLERRTP